MSPSLCIWVVIVHQQKSDRYKQDRKNCAKKELLSSSAWICENWVIKSWTQQKISHCKEGLQRAFASQSKTATPDTSYHFTPKRPMNSLTSNPQSTTAHTCASAVAALLNQSSEPCSLSHRQNKGKKNISGDFLQAMDPSWTKVALCNPRWRSKLTEGVLTCHWSGFSSSSPCLQFSWFGSNSELTYSPPHFLWGAEALGTQFLSHGPRPKILNSENWTVKVFLNP